MKYKHAAAEHSIDYKAETDVKLSEMCLIWFYQHYALVCCNWIDIVSYHPYLVCKIMKKEDRAEKKKIRAGSLR